MTKLFVRIKNLPQKSGVYPAPFGGIKFLPKRCGIYFFKNKSSTIIYIGKAANLKSRVSSYWQKSTSLSPAKQRMLEQVKKIDFEVTDSEIEALLLEASLIKKHQPPFNVIFRDDKSFVYIAISAEAYPRVYLTRQVEKEGKYFGPFVSAEAVKETLRVVRRFLPFRSCRALSKRPCLYYQISRCPGPCVEAVTKEDYQKIIQQIILFLEGKRCKGFKKQIPNHQLEEVNKVLAHSKVISWLEKVEIDLRELARTLSLPEEPKRIEGYDISNIVGCEATGAMVVFTNGEPDKSEYRKFKIKLAKKPDDVAMMGEMLGRRFMRISSDLEWFSSLSFPRKRESTPDQILDSRFRGNDTDSSDNKRTWPKPDLIIVDGGKGQLNVASRVLKKYKLDIPVIALAKAWEKIYPAPFVNCALHKDLLVNKRCGIYFPEQKKPLELPKNSPALHLVMRVRDEAHRFAIGYHKLLRKKKMLGRTERRF